MIESRGCVCRHQGGSPINNDGYKVMVLTYKPDAATPAYEQKLKMRGGDGVVLSTLASGREKRTMHAIQSVSSADGMAGNVLLTEDLYDVTGAGLKAYGDVYREAAREKEAAERAANGAATSLAEYNIRAVEGLNDLTPYNAATAGFGPDCEL